MPCLVDFVCLLALAPPACRSAPLSHPRIFITPGDVPRLRAMPSDTDENALGYVPAEAWEKLKAQADEFMAAGPYHYAVDMPGREGGPSQRWEYTLSDEPPSPHEEYSHYPPWTAMFQERGDAITTRLKYLLLAYVVTDDPAYFERAKQIVLHLCAWPGTWTDPTYGGGKPCLDTGHAATWVGIFYDWSHDSLTDAERQTIRAALTDKALAPIDGMMDGVSPYHNYTAVIATGLCIGAIALLDEDERAEGWIEHATARATLNFDAQGKDGGAMEGPMYGTYAADSFADMLWALATAGIESDLPAHPYLETLPRYCISLLNPNNFQQPCFGDGGPGVGFGRLMLALALGGDTDAAWYCERTGQLQATTVRGFIALDPARLNPVQPTRNPSDAFVDVGYAILRDGYRPDAAFLALKAGPPEAVIGHNHYDHNSFVMNYAGTWIAWDPGYRSYFNPPERKYTSSTIGHNSIVLDLSEEYLNNYAVTMPGHDQVSLNKGRIGEFFTSEAFDYVLGEAGATYNPEDAHVLDRFGRQMVFAKPNVFFIRDTLAAPEEHTYSFLLHLDAAGEFEIEADHARAIGTQCLLQTHVFSPSGIDMTAASYPGAESRGPYLAATTGRARETTITTVLVPRRHGKLIANPGFEKAKAGWKPRNMPGFVENHVIDTEVKHGGDASARIDNGGYYYSRNFSLPADAKITARWWAKCTAETGASSILYYWADGKAFASTSGPVANVNEWRQYELTDVVPEGTQEICLALQFFGEGQCWYDDVEVSSDQHVPQSDPAKVTALEDGASGAVVEVDGVTHFLVCGAAGTMRTVEAGSHRITTDAQLAVVSLHPDGPKAFVLRATTINLDGQVLSPIEGEWRVTRAD
jgi:hypothetical protein